MNPILEEDIKAFSLPEELVEQLRGAAVAVTGATGLIGSTLVRCLLVLDADIKLILPVRSYAKASAIFGHPAATIVETDLCEYFRTAAAGIDYIIHCASPTDGSYMAAHPAETFLLAVESTKAILDYARRCNTKGVVYLSSIEYYGQIFNSDPVTEDMNGHIDHTSPRSSYGLGKQAAEYLAVSYAAEYGVQAKIARLTQTFGAGIAPTDGRVFAQFARSVIAGRDIVLHTEGRSAKPYCYTTDAVAALLFILLKGEAGKAYNVATPGTYVTVRQLAEMMRDLFNPAISVTFEAGHAGGYAPETTVNLDSSRLQALGWVPQHDLPDMLSRLILYLKSENEQR